MKTKKDKETAFSSQSQGTFFKDLDFRSKGMKTPENDPMP